MGVSSKTFKDTKEEKELNKLYREKKEGHREERGGHKNLLRDVADMMLDEDAPVPSEESDDAF